jgi:hypothetical protein
MNLITYTIRPNGAHNFFRRLGKVFTRLGFSERPLQHALHAKVDSPQQYNGAPTFIGIKDDSRHLHFTVTDSARHITLSFAGGVQADGDLSGSYCNLDQNGQCADEYGIWSVVPVATE